MASGRVRSFVLAIAEPMHGASVSRAPHHDEVRPLRKSGRSLLAAALHRRLMAGEPHSDRRAVRNRRSTLGAVNNEVARINLLADGPQKLALPERVLHV